MDGSDARRCLCGTRLARDHRGRRCTRCQQRARAWSHQPPPVPPDFWDTPAMRSALAAWHMGRLIRAFRTHPYHGEPVSQERAAAWLNLTQTAPRPSSAALRPDRHRTV